MFWSGKAGRPATVPARQSGSIRVNGKQRRGYGFREMGSIDKVTAQFGCYGWQELHVADFELAATNSNWFVKRLSRLFRAGNQGSSGTKRVCWGVRRSKYVFRT